jgi:putative alpha-1,2-mannosidase
LPIGKGNSKIIAIINDAIGNTCLSHKIKLNTYGVTAELTSTTRVGFHRYTFPKSDSSFIQFDFTTVLGSSETQEAKITQISGKQIVGEVVMASTIRRPKPITVYFVADFDKAFEQFGGWKDGSIINTAKEISGAHTGAFVRFKTNENDIRMMKVAISYVSIEEAKKKQEEAKEGKSATPATTAAPKTGVAPPT